MSEKLDEMKKEATELGISFSPNIGEAKLQSKIDAFYESKEDKVKEPVVEVEETVEEEKSPTLELTGKARFRAMARKLEAAARKTRIVTIVDNDQRVNNQTTSCTVNAGNEFFDLGTIILPLNEKVEVRQGHIDALKEIRIPQHVKDRETKLSRMVMRNRYSVSYED